MQVLFSMPAVCSTGLMACALAGTAANAQGTAANVAPNVASNAARSAGNQPPPDRNPAPLTAEQVVRVKGVLAAYKAATLKADDAKAIKRALRDAGLQHNAALDKAITDAGFSPQRLEELDPRPARPSGPPGTQGDIPPPPRSTDGTARKP